VIPITVEAESVDTNGALAIVHAASDELLQRYGGDGDNKHLNVDELRPRSGSSSSRDTAVTSWVASDFARSPTRSPLRGGQAPLGATDLRREGIGLALMKEIESRAKALGYVTLFLETGPAQPRPSRSIS